MNILIDGRPLVTTSTGISNFLKCSIIAWAKAMPKSMFYVALPQAIDKTSSDWQLEKNVHLIIEQRKIFEKLPNLIWLNAIVPILVDKYQIDVYFSALPCIPFFLPKRIKKIIVVHDVVNLEFKETLQWTNIIANKLFFERSIKRANILWANSNYTKGKVQYYFPNRICKEIFVGDAADKSVFHLQQIEAEEETALKSELGIKKDFIMFVGSLEPRKNLSFLLSLMPELYKRTQLQLVIVGAKKWKSSGIKNIIEEKNFPRESVIFCKFIPDEKLAQLYRIAKCYVSTSLNEGFGMPQLEALQCGCKVVTAHNSAMVEIAEGKTGAYTVKGFEPKTWISCIQEAVDSKKQPVPKELDQYDWDIILKKFIDINF